MHSDEDTLYGHVRNGVLTISGNNPSIRIDGGRLIVKDGPHIVPATHRGPAPPVEERMETLRFTRAEAASGALKRIIVTRPDGFVTFAALKWLHEVGCSVMQLDYDGTVIAAFGPAGPDQPALRRAQVLAADNEIGLAVMREILRVKLDGQAEVARLIVLPGDGESVSQDEAAAYAVAQFAELIAGEPAGAKILWYEATAAVAYWRLWESLPLRFARRDEVPESWQTFGPRSSPLTGKPFRAATPGHALFNYLYRILEAEMTIALLAVGLDPGIAIFHLDRDRRSSLSLDAIEAIRPYVDCWLAAWLATSRFAKRDFIERPDGEIRITRPLTSHLAMTAPIWRQAAQTVALWLAQSFGKAIDADTMPSDDALSVSHAAPSLPQRKPGALAAGGRFLPALAPPLPAFVGPAHGRRLVSLKAGLKTDPTPRACHECGRALAPKQRRFCSTDCAGSFHLAMRRLIPIESGNAIAIRRGGAGDEIRSGKLRRAAAARGAWDREHAITGRQRTETAARGPLRRWYVEMLMPRLAKLRPVDIARAADLSHSFARQIVAGRMPHPRHFAALARLAGVPAPKSLPQPPGSNPAAIRGYPDSVILKGGYQDV
jgi:CRISPR-associated endonuclease Cas1